jgi:hypothetical protein
MPAHQDGRDAVGVRVRDTTPAGNALVVPGTGYARVCKPVTERMTIATGKASGSANRLLQPESVRHMSATTAMQGRTAAHHDTQRDNSKAAREPGYAQATGRFRRWWQVLGSNHVGVADGFTGSPPLSTGTPLSCGNTTVVPHPDCSTITQPRTPGHRHAQPGTTGLRQGRHWAQTTLATQSEDLGSPCFLERRHIADCAACQCVTWAGPEAPPAGYERLVRLARASRGHKTGGAFSAS